MLVWGLCLLDMEGKHVDIDVEPLADFSDELHVPFLVSIFIL
jgi:hypothetical protein